MDKIKNILLILAILFCFAIAGYIEDPNDYYPNNQPEDYYIIEEAK